MTSPSMVHRSGDTLVVRSVVSGDALYQDNKQDENLITIGGEKVADGNSNNEEEDDLDLPQCKIKRNYTCTECSFYSQNPRSYLYHLKDVHKQKIRVYECPSCLYASKHSQKLQRHVHMVHVMNKRGNKQIAKKKKPKRPPPLITIDHNMLADEAKITTEVVENGERLKCSICGFTTHNTGVMSRHEKLVHLKKRFFRCSKCNYVTHMRARYTKHVKYHSMPMIKCDLCDFRTPYKWNLDRHYKNHTGDGAFKCALCNFTADIKQSLTVHEMNHHVPPVGQAGTGVGIARRRNKVGASDTLAQEEIGQEEMELLRMEREDTEDGHAEFLQVVSMGRSTTTNQLVSLPNNAIGGFVQQVPKIRVTFKKLKTQNVQEHSERHDFQTDLINPDDIIQRKDSIVYIKSIKCRYCGYKSASEAEMDRHKSKVHGIQKSLTAKKVPRPIPNLIPIQNKPSPLNSVPILRIPSVRNRTGPCPPKPAIEDQVDEGLSEQDLNEICAKSCPNSSLRDFASLMGGADVFNNVDENVTSFMSKTIKTEPEPDSEGTACSESSSVNRTKLCSLPYNTSFKKKNSSFFDKLKEKLLGTGDTCNLTCWCGHVSKCLTEFMRHQKMHNEDPNGMVGISAITGMSNLSSTRCQHCRQRCKTSSDLMIHLQSCQEANKSTFSSGVNYEDLADDDLEPKGTREHSCYQEAEEEMEPGAEVEMEVETSEQGTAGGLELDKEEEVKTDVEIGKDSEAEIEGDRDEEIEGETEEAEGKTSSATATEEGAEGQVEVDVQVDADTNTHEDIVNGGAQAAHPMENKVFVWNSFQESQEADCEEECLQKMPLSEDDRSKSPTSEGSLVGIEMAPGYGAVMGSSQDAPTGTDEKQPVKKVFKCPHCTFWASTASRFHVHIVGHLNKKPFECSLCAYRSNWRWDITKHIRLKSARDKNHESAGVLMTDETGRRNYSKYNKYLTLMRVHEPTAESSGSGRRTKGTAETPPSPSLRITQLHPILPAPPTLTRVSDSLSCLPLSTPLRPPPPLRAAHLVLVATTPRLDKNTGLLLKRPGIEGKKTFWKCKKCNFRVASRELVLAHVKEHYQQRGVTHAGPGAMAKIHATHGERHCRLKHSGDVRVVRGGRSKLMAKREIDEDSQDELGEVKECEPSSPSVDQADIEHAKVDAQGKQMEKPTSQVEMESENEKMGQAMQLGTDGNPTKRYKCVCCPYVSNSKSQFLYHKQFHRPRGAPFKCGLCSYNVSRRHLLHQHLKVHGILIPPQKSFTKQMEDGVEEGANEIEEVNVTSSGLDTCHLAEIPLVWVSRENNFIKMFKCRFCPHVNMRKANIHEHEKMHTNRAEDSLRTDSKNEADRITSHLQQHHCPDCNYICNNAGVLSSHAKVHQGMYGQVHGLVDSSKTDEVQIKELAGLEKEDITSDQAQYTQIAAAVDLLSNTHNQQELGRNGLAENDRFKTENAETVEENKKDTRLMYFCMHCPARFLYAKELGIHVRFHEMHLPYHCDLCSYTARQHPHLLAHLKVHSDEYRERTNAMLSLFEVSPQHPRPQSAPCHDSIEGLDMQGPAWVVIGGNLQQPTTLEGNCIDEQSAVKQHCKQYSCHLCPATFFKSIALQYHLSLHGGLGPHQCQYCDYAVKTYGNLVKHEMIHNNIYPPKNNTSHIKIKSKVLMASQSLPLSGTDLFEHRIKAQKRERLMPKNNHNLSSYEHPVTPMHVDPQFGILMHGNPEFVYPTYLKNGRLKEKRYKCHKCPSAFEKREQYKVHLSLHGAKQRYRCEKCDYSVKYYANYIQHMRKHQNNEQAMLARKLEMGQELGKNEQEGVSTPASVSSQVNIQLTSQGPRSAKTTCNSSLSNQSSPLQLSVADHQSMLLQKRSIPIAASVLEASEEAKKSFWCPHCPYSSIRRDGVENHIKRHEAVSGIRGVFVCSHCDYSVPQQHFLREHNKLHFTPTRKLPDVYMMCSRTELWAEESGKENVADGMKVEVHTEKTTIFQDLGCTKASAERFLPLLLNCLDSADHRNEEKIYVNVNTGELAGNQVTMEQHKIETSNITAMLVKDDLCDIEKPKIADPNIASEDTKCSLPFHLSLINKDNKASISNGSDVGSEIIETFNKTPSLRIT